MKPNFNISPEHLVHHPEFIEWVLNPNDTSDQYWEMFLIENPSRKKEFDEGIILVKALNPKEKDLTEDAVTMMWNRINRRISEQKKPVFYISRWVAAASILLVLGVSGAIYFQLTQDRNNPINYEAIAKIEPTDNEVKLIFSDQTEEIINSKDIEIIYNSDGEVVVNSDLKLAQKQLESKDNGEQLNQLVVPRGKRTSLTLSDGTKLWLNSGSRAIYPAVFNKKEREIFIEGEAYLEVAHDATKPFYVVTNQIHVKVLGTKFNVSAYPDDAAASVVLVEGSVQATVDSKKVTMKPNQLLTYEKNTKATELEETDVLPYTSWKDGWMYCEKESMEAIATKLSRFYNVKIEFKDQKTRELTLTGKLDLKTECADIFKAISSTAPIAYEIQNDVILLSNKQIN
jgi:transmembrane sensor